MYSLSMTGVSATKVSNAFCVTKSKKAQGIAKDETNGSQTSKLEKSPQALVAFFSKEILTKLVMDWNLPLGSSLSAMVWVSTTTTTRSVGKTCSKVRGGLGGAWIPSISFSSSCRFSAMFSSSSSSAMLGKFIGQCFRGRRFCGGVCGRLPNPKAFLGFWFTGFHEIGCMSGVVNDWGISNLSAQESVQDSLKFFKF